MVADDRDDVNGQALRLLAVQKVGEAVTLAGDHDDGAQLAAQVVDAVGGVKFFGDMSNSGIVENLTKAASILGLMVIGAMIASTVNITIPLEIGVSGASQPLQTYIDQIMPCLLPLLIFGIMYWLLGKNVKTTTILVFLIIISCIGTFFGIL